VGSFTGPLEIEIQVSAGTTVVLQDELEALSAAAAGTLPNPALGFGTEGYPLPGDHRGNGAPTIPKDDRVDDRVDDR
jgi:hypothetical protein